ncbi:DUF6894 family protein [Sphingomonas xinjiangensis]|uniref:DUF6894 domain-containing protein n=1 Tax=Sphingomonas xinjiangensis TaxID=643568 RepID=A0A840Y6I5_9SPHN|nr:hypothetical protein [Sphingomonas xinjiangensis]MBB5708887.1 hypothetical protein [Sphingomonas xinjiangensis]
MPSYSFHLQTARSTQLMQGSGRDFPDLRSALAEAQRAARSLIHKQVRRAPCALHGSLDIRDERGSAVARILLAEVARQIS